MYYYQNSQATLMITVHSIFFTELMKTRFAFYLNNNHNYWYLYKGWTWYFEIYWPLGRELVINIFLLNPNE